MDTSRSKPSTVISRLRVGLSPRVQTLECLTRLVYHLLGILPPVGVMHCFFSVLFASISGQGRISLTAPYRERIPLVLLPFLVLVHDHRMILGHGLCLPSWVAGFVCLHYYFLSFSLCGQDRGKD